MKKESQIVTNYIFDEKEFNLIDICLGYCRHRLTQHSECGITGKVNLELLKKMKKEFDRIRDEKRRDKEIDDLEL